MQESRLLMKHISSFINCVVAVKVCESIEADVRSDFIAEIKLMKVGLQGLRTSVQLESDTGLPRALGVVDRVRHQLPATMSGH
jgi:hypothetical protein